MLARHIQQVIKKVHAALEMVGLLEVLHILNRHILVWC